MPHADVGDVHVNRLLTQMSVGYRPDGYIADQIFPIVMVDKQSDIIPFYDQSPWYRDEGDKIIRAPGTEAAKTGLTVDTSNTYFAVNHALGGDIPFELLDNQDNPFNMDRDLTRLLNGLLMLRRDRQFAASYMTTGQWGTDFTVSAKWSDYGASTPISDMRAQQRTIRRAVGMRGNKWVLGDLVWQRLQDHPELVQRLPDNSLRNPTRAQLASLLELDGGAILVGESLVTTDAEGVAEASVTYSDVWDDDALCIYVPSRPGLFEPAAGYTFVWRNSVAPSITFMRSYEDTKTKVRTIEAHGYWHQRLLLSGAGSFGADVVD